MSTKEIISRDYHSSFNSLAEIIKARQIDLDQKHYVVVPEKYSLYAEQILFSKRGAFDVEPISFARLFLKYHSGEEQSLVRSGAIMLLKKIALDNQKKLKAFKRSAPFNGFAEKMYETLETIAVAKITPEQLKAEGATGAKLDDIALIYDEYKKLTSGKYIDAVGQMSLFYDELEKADLSKTSFYFVGFDNYTTLEREIIELVKQKAKNTIEFKVAPPSNKYGSVEFYDASDVYSQIKAVCVDIRGQVVNGNMYKDYCIATSSGEQDLISRILTECEIPHFVDKKHKVIDSELFRFLDNLNDCVTFGQKRNDILSVAKNYYSGVYPHHAMRFENYANKYSVSYKGFYAPFKKGEPFEYEKAEEVRERIMSLHNYYEQESKKVESSEDFYNFIIKIMKKIDAGSRTTELSNMSDMDLQQMYDAIIMIAELIKNLNIAKGTYADYFSIFTEGLNACKISLIPKVSDAVVVGTPPAFRCQRFKKVYAVDFTEGSLPEVILDTDIITDSEAQVLNENGASYPMISHLNVRAKTELMYLLTSCDDLFLAYSSEGDKRVSPLEAEIKASAKAVKYTRYIDEINAISDSEAYLRALKSNDKTYYSKIAQSVATKGNALEMLVSSKAMSKIGGKPLPFVSELEEVVGKEVAHSFTKNKFLPPTNLDGSGSMFFRNPSVSVSKIQSYFGCPYASFVSSVLRLKEAESGELSPADIGSLLHKAIEVFVVGKKYSTPEKTMKKILGDIASENYKYLLSSNKPLYDRICKEAVVLASKVAYDYNNGEFSNAGVELSFGTEDSDNLKTIEFKTKKQNISLRGQIDRIDIHGDYARVVDYKTGAKSGAKFSAKKYYYGTHIQLGIYLSILMENGHKPAGMFYFPLSARWDDDEYVHRLSGVYNKGEKIVYAFDDALLDTKAKSRIIDCSTNKDTNEKGFPIIASSKNALDEDELKEFSKYAVSVLRGAVVEISEDYINASPNEVTCSYCKYNTLCYYNTKSMKVRKYASVSNDDILQAEGE